MLNSTNTEKYVKPLSTLSLADVPLVGGKNASLGEMIRELTPLGIRIPEGYAITSAGYWHFVRQSGLSSVLETEHSATRADTLHQVGENIRRRILSSDLPADLEAEILTAYRSLSDRSGKPVPVAVRSSATAEDLPQASFAGAQESFLNVVGEKEVLSACKACYASLFTDRAISYRRDIGFAVELIALSIGIQRMVRSDIGSSGVLFTIETESGFPNVALINANYGLGETVVRGSVIPDEFVVFKPTLFKGFKPLIRRRLGSKEVKLVIDPDSGNELRLIPVSEPDRRRLCIEDHDALKLAQWGCEIEKHYSLKYGRPTPMDIEWAKDGTDGELYIVQARPETIHANRSPNLLETYNLQMKGPVLLTGQSVGHRIASGRVRIIHDPSELSSLTPGEVLVTEKTDPDWEPMMKLASAIITDRGGRTCHAAIVSRELGVPAIVGTGDGTRRLREGTEVTVSCAEGEVGSVYEGKLGFYVKTLDLKSIPRPHTKIMMNISQPAEAFRLSFLPNDGVGLARVEFIINHSVQIHPMALIHPDQVTDLGERSRIADLTQGYPHPQDYFVDKLAEGIATIAAAFYPKPVIVRLSDLKSDEYAHLLGGKTFEPIEDNPMIGFRGASRYIHPRYREGFALECRAVIKAREELGLRNIKVMVPFCRTVEEGRAVIKEMAGHGLRQGKDLEIYVMCEIPSNVLLASEFASIFDGFSIGSNDLTQLTLGVDRNSEILAPLFDERNPAVTHLIRQAIRALRKKGKPIGICGEAPSDYPEFARFLVQEGITSISLNPDSLLNTTFIIAEHEDYLRADSGIPKLA